MDLSKRLKDYRGNRPQAHVAVELGCTHQLVSQMEGGGKPGRSMVKPLIRVLALSTEERRELIAWVLGFEPADFDAALGLDEETPTNGAA